MTEGNDYGLRCYEGPDASTPSIQVVANQNGVTLFDQNIGRPAYHIVAPSKPDHVNNAIN